MEEERLRSLEAKVDTIERFLSVFIGSDRYTIQKDLQIFDGRNISTAKGTGTQICTEVDQKLAFWGKTPIVQPLTIANPSLSTVTDAGNTTNNNAINANFTALDTAVEALISRMAQIGLIP